MGIQENTKISINIPNDMLKEMSDSAVENERTLTGEIMYRLKRYDRGLLGVGLGTSLPEVSASVSSEDYSELIEVIGGTLDRDVDFDERAKLNARVKEAGLLWNAYKRRLEKWGENGYKIIHQF